MEIVHTISTGLLSAEPEAGREVKTLKFVMNEYYFVLDISSNGLDKNNRLDPGSVLNEKASLVLAETLYYTR